MESREPDPEPRRAVRRYDAIDRFIVLVEQLDLAAELVAAGSLAKARMALVAADNLAELLLNRQARAVFESSEGSHWIRRRRYGSKERERILGDFKRKVALALRPADGPIWRSVEPILDEGDAALMRVAHRYRNGVYHEDRHNETLLAPLSALYLQAVGRAFCRGYRPGSAVGGGLRDRVTPLERWGYKLIDQQARPETFEFRAAAEQVVARICDPMEVRLRELTALLEEDLLLRNSQVRRRAELLLQDGMAPERLDFVIVWSQFWEAHGADETAQRLDERGRRLSDLLREAEEDSRQEIEGELGEVEAARIARWHELQEGFKAEVSTETTEEIARLAPRLGQASTAASMLERYERLDNRLRALEEAVGEAESAWGEMIDRAAAAARGD
jgi:hypothetical protein